MKMKQMPYKIEPYAIEEAKLRAKSAVREVANPAQTHEVLLTGHWKSVVAIVAVIVIGVFGLVKFGDDLFHGQTTMEELIAEMQTAPDDIIGDWAVDAGYYVEEEDRL